MERTHVMYTDMVTYNCAYMYVWRSVIVAIFFIVTGYIQMYIILIVGVYIILYINIYIYICIYIYTIVYLCEYAYVVIYIYIYIHKYILSRAHYWRRYLDFCNTSGIITIWETTKTIAKHNEINIRDSIFIGP